MGVFQLSQMATVAMGNRAGSLFLDFFNKMDENIEQIIAKIELDETFNEEISLNRLIGNKNGREIVQCYIDSYYSDLAAGRNPQHKAILLIGEKGSGIHVFARAISNSFGNLCFHTVSGNWLSDGVIHLNHFFGEGDEFSSYYISADNKLSAICQGQLCKILNEKQISEYDWETKSWIKKKFENRLVILSVENKDMLAYPLLKQFPIQVNLRKLSVAEITLALTQRLALLGWKISSVDLLGQIAQASQEIGRAMEVLAMSYRVMRSKGEEILSEVHLNKALRLLNENMKAAGQKTGG